jgi:lipopolysaccharide transport system ATP-binding protein
MSDVLLKVEGLSKKFCMSLKRSMLYGTYDVARDMFGFPQKNIKLRTSEFWALQEINFELKRGETLGLIGQNGCGKTTLLRLLNGIFPPDKGKITIKGRIGALIAVGAGFHPHMTGRENIFLNGAILGMTKSEIKRKFDEIVDFAEIGEFIDAPVATYSSGMTVRLGFAIAIHCEPDILLVDEILAVGDVSFVGKCFNKIEYLQEIGTGIILVTHNTQTVLDFCQRGILLNHGAQILDATANEAIKKYEIVLNQEKLEKLEKKENCNKEITTEQSSIKSRCFIKGLENSSDNEVASDQPVTFCYEIISELELDNAFVTFHIYSAQGIPLVHIRNDEDNLGPLKIQKGSNRINITIPALNLEGGSYPCSFVLFNRDDSKPIMDHVFVNPGLIIRGVKKNDNVLKVERKWEVFNNQEQVV